MPDKTAARSREVPWLGSLPRSNFAVPAFGNPTFCEPIPDDASQDRETRQQIDRAKITSAL